MAVAFVIGFAMMWNDTKKEINNVWYDSMKKENDLPEWVHVAQKVPDNFFTRKLLRTDLVYSVPDFTRENSFWNILGNSLDETKKHDPLVMTAEFLTGKLHLTGDIKIKILKSMYELKHEAQDRLWSGDHLLTSNVNTEVRFWPDCNMTYTEKTVTVSK